MADANACLRKAIVKICHSRGQSLNTRQLVLGLEGYDHLLRCRLESLLRRIAIKRKKRVEEHFVQLLDLIEYYPVQRKAIKIPIDSRHLVTQVNPLMFHSKEAIADN